MSGRNDSAQLASRPKRATDDGQCYICEPTRASALEAHMIDAVACGDAFTVAVTQAGDMIGWGVGSMGQLGPPPVEKQAVPRRIKGLDGVRIERVATGLAHTMALSQQYQVYSFGAGTHGVLGLGNTDNRCASIGSVMSMSIVFPAWILAPHFHRSCTHEATERCPSISSYSSASAEGDSA
jgi:alpha-tubulin suppressor-like RCC1 family protein